MSKCRVILPLLLLTLAIASATGGSQESGGPILSPPARAACKFSDGKTISVNYSSPRMKGRKIYGDLVPYGEVWRVGANEATTFATTANSIVGGKLIPAGKYTLFAVPNPDRWTLVISKKTGEWGIPYRGAGDDLLRTDMKAGKLAQRVEDFAITFDQAGATCTMHLDWETTRASIEISEKK